MKKDDGGRSFWGQENDETLPAGQKLGYKFDLDSETVNSLCSWSGCYLLSRPVPARPADGV